MGLSQYRHTASCHPISWAYKGSKVSFRNILFHPSLFERLFPDFEGYVLLSDEFTPFAPPFRDWTFFFTWFSILWWFDSKFAHGFWSKQIFHQPPEPWYRSSFPPRFSGSVSLFSWVPAHCSWEACDISPLSPEGGPASSHRLAHVIVKKNF